MSPHFLVIAGLDPAIHSVGARNIPRRNGLDARIKSGHDNLSLSFVIAGLVPAIQSRLCKDARDFARA
jgi:hypothetical protein